MTPHLSGLIASRGRWALRGLLAVSLGAALAGSGIAAAGASSLAHSASHPITKLAPRGVAHNVDAGNLINHGGPVEAAPKVYVVFWHWVSDPSGERLYLRHFLSSVGGTPWLSTVNQYGGGSTGDLLAGTWSDSRAIPGSPSDSAIQTEAARAATHFGVGSSSPNVQIVVATPTGHSTPGFGTQWCAYHGVIGASSPDTYTDLPYMTDAGSSCGEDSVSATLDGVSIVEGHEMAESITDPELNAWYDSSGQEIGDKCAWMNLHDITTSKGSFAVQPLWSNAISGCAG